MEGSVGGTVRLLSIPRWSGWKWKVTGLTPGPAPRLGSMARGLPLRKTAQGEAVAGTALQGPGSRRMACTPTIPAHGPLVIEVWDGLAQRRSLGGCTYHCRPSRRTQFRNLSRQCQ